MPLGRRVVVTTLLGAAVACGPKSPPLPEEPVISNPPGPGAELSPPEPEPERMSQHDLTRFTVTLNPVDAEQRRIYRRSEPVCYVNLPFPPGDQPVTSFRPPPEQEVPCPPELTDPSWADCAYGTVNATEDLSSCVCLVMGNPPPPPRRLAACPTAPRPAAPTTQSTTEP